VIDIERTVKTDEGRAGWQSGSLVPSGMGGWLGGGLGGPEARQPARALHGGFWAVLWRLGRRACHTRERRGPASIGARCAQSARPAHWSRGACLEDPFLWPSCVIAIFHLGKVCPTSIVACTVVPSRQKHMLPRLLAEGERFAQYR